MHRDQYRALETFLGDERTARAQPTVHSSFLMAAGSAVQHAATKKQDAIWSSTRVPATALLVSLVVRLLTRHRLPEIWTRVLYLLQLRQRQS